MQISEGESYTSSYNQGYSRIVTGLYFRKPFKIYRQHMLCKNYHLRISSSQNLSNINKNGSQYCLESYGLNTNCPAIWGHLMRNKVTLVIWNILVFHDSMCFDMPIFRKLFGAIFPRVDYRLHLGPEALKYTGWFGAGREEELRAGVTLASFEWYCLSADFQKIFPQGNFLSKGGKRP